MAEALKPLLTEKIKTYTRDGDSLLVVTTSNKIVRVGYISDGEQTVAAPVPAPAAKPQVGPGRPKGSTKKAPVVAPVEATQSTTASYQNGADQEPQLSA